MAFRFLVCAIVTYLCVAETPHSHPQAHLQAEVSQDGRILMHEAPDEEPVHDTELSEGHEEPEKDTELHEGKRMDDHEEEEDKPDEATDEAKDEAELLEAGGRHELAEGEELIFENAGWRRRRRSRRRRAVPCVWHGWGAWSKCTKGCGGGTQERKRGVKVHAAHGGAGCTGGAVARQACNKHACPINCVWHNFGAWQKCSKSCGGGIQARTRGVRIQAAHGGANCAGPAKEEKKCGTQPCPVDCKYGEWGDWGDCSVTCGNGTRKHTREVETEAKHSGKACEGEPEEEGECDPPPEKCSAFTREVTSLAAVLLLLQWMVQ